MEGRSMLTARARPSIGGYDVFAIGGLLVALASAWWFRVSHLDLKIAVEGASPFLFSDSWLHPERYAGDFDSSATELLKSLPMWVYPFAQTLGLPLEPVIGVMIALELAVLAVASFWSARLLAPAAGVPGAAIAAIFVATGAMAAANLSNFGFPFYGWVYGFGYAGALAGVAEAARGSLRRAALWLALAFASHPIIAIFGGAWAGLIVLVTLRQRSVREILESAAIFLVPALGWTALIISTGRVDTGGIDQSLFSMIVHAMSYHWRPVELGIFTILGDRGALPMLGMLAAMAVAADVIVDREVRKFIALGAAAMMLIAAIGVLSSWQTESPLLLKLSLQRATGFVSVVGALLVGAMIWRDVVEGTRLERAAGVYLALSAFVPGFGVGLAPIVVRAGVHLWTRRKQMSAGAGVAAFFALAAIAFALYAQTRGWLTNWMDGAHIGAPWAALVGAAAVFLPPRRWAGAALAVACAVSAFFWARTTDTLGSATSLARAKDFYAAQMWARQNTPARTIFMLDPAQGYGWRDISQRPSFGGVRDWLHSSIIYNSRPALLEEGIKRAEFVGVNPGAYLSLELSPSVRAGQWLDEALRGNYYTADAPFFAAAAKQFGVGYVVFEKQYMPAPSPLPVAYQNDHFVIAKAP